jgi:hypothetical protein
MIDLTTIGPLGQFLGGLAAFLTVAFALFAWVWKWVGGAKREIIEATTASMNRLIASNMLDACAGYPPEDYYTLDVNWEGGLSLMVPMFPFRELLVSENIRMCVINHDAEGTTMSLRCKGFGHFPRHHHATTCETIEVRTGHITHLETGRKYGPGEVWFIPPGEVHSAVLDNCSLIVVHRPPLPTAAIRPVDLSSMHKDPPTK